MSPDGKTRFLVVQTGFLGDLVLTLPCVQLLRDRMEGALITVAAIPPTAPALENHPAVAGVLVYDKKGSDAGWAGFRRVKGAVRSGGFDAAVIPHRSIRSAALCRLGGIRRRIGFDRSAGRFLLTDVVPYRRDLHESARNIRLLHPLGIREEGIVLPALYPDEEDRKAVDALLRAGGVGPGAALAAVAPGSVWATKRWPEDRYVTLVRGLRQAGMGVVLVGGPGDAALAGRIREAAGAEGVLNAAGPMSILQSAELIGRCRVCITNDSAPLHLAAAMRTPAVAIFGPTVPAFGFGPVGERDAVVELAGLGCRPCAIHGGRECPIGTFECMKGIPPGPVLVEALRSAGCPG
ncbi:MAG: glycosyltransferase family 9 protein [Bacteroidota bacterium]